MASSLLFIVLLLHTGVLPSSGQGPDQVTGLRAQPDFTSLLLSWGPPSGDGSQKYVTGYLVIYRLWRGKNPLGRVRLERDVSSYEVAGLMPNLTYEITVQAVVEAMVGEVVTIVVSTRAIDRVEGVVVHVLSPTSVNVSWIPLNSGDVAIYMVDYFLKQQPVGVAGRAGFPGSSSWGIVTGLQDGQEYEFQVTAAVQINGVLMEGEFKSVITVNSAVVLDPAGRPGASRWLYPTIGAILLVLGILTSLVLLAIGIRIIRKRNVKIHGNICYEPTRQTNGKKFGDNYEHPVYEDV